VSASDRFCLSLLPKKPSNSLTEIVGFLRRDGKKGIELTIEELCAPVDPDTEFSSIERRPIIALDAN